MENPPRESFKQLTISVEKLPSSTGRQAKISSYAIQRARLLLGCYRTGDANDPETYVAAISAVLARFPEQTITDVTHPVTGIPSKITWLPTIKEVRDACEAAVYLAENARIRDKRIAEQLAARAEDDRLRAGRRLTLEELKAKYGDNWGLSDPLAPQAKTAQQAPAWDTITDGYSSDPSRLARLLRKDSDPIENESNGS